MELTAKSGESAICTLVSCISPEPGCLGGGVLGSIRLVHYPWSPGLGDTYLDCVDLEIDGLGAHANIVGDDIQDEGVHRPGCVQGRGL